MTAVFSMNETYRGWDQGLHLNGCGHALGAAAFSAAGSYLLLHL